ncbi:MAG: site-specific DNA-methyltransferase [Armatimonadota bacterium]|nr:site-specific DNA-methyltransferase [Armatimonadota bacterium]
MHNCQVICGDATVCMREIEASSVDLVIADPPYNLGKDYGNNKDLKAWHEYEQFTQDWLAEALRIMKPTASIYVFMGVRFISRLFAIMEERFHLEFNGWITWHYTQGMGRKNGFSPRHEDILFFTKSSTYKFNLDSVRVPQKYFRNRNNMTGANPGDVWQFSHVHYCSAEREQHPTQKPEALMERMLRASTDEGDLVVDPFVGSGTTCRVASALNRRCIGIDLNPDYAAMSRERIGKPFDMFDSIDPRMNRTPRDLPNTEYKADVEDASITTPALFNDW